MSEGLIEEEKGLWVLRQHDKHATVIAVAPTFEDMLEVITSQYIPHVVSSLTYTLLPGWTTDRVPAIRWWVMTLTNLNYGQPRDYRFLVTRESGMLMGGFVTDDYVRVFCRRESLRLG